MTRAARPTALVLLGPTGAGKTPLGAWLERRGLGGRPCLHFDFGAQLRRIAAGRWRPPGLRAADRAAIERALRAGALLEDDQFPIARRVLRAFLAERAAGADVWLALNGLPRHAGQAAALDRLVRVRLVVALACSPAVVRARIRANSGGDRRGRSDDTAAAIRRRLALFRRRTAPLLDLYAARGVQIVVLKVGTATRAAELWKRLADAVRPDAAEGPA